MTKLVTQSMNEQLPLGKRLGVRFHLSICSRCRAFQRQIRALRCWLRALGGEASDDFVSFAVKLPDPARDKIKAALDRERPS